MLKTQRQIKQEEHEAGRADLDQRICDIDEVIKKSCHAAESVLC